MGLGRDLVYGSLCLLTSPIWGAALLRTGKHKTDWPARLGAPATAPGSGSGPGGSEAGGEARTPKLPETNLPGGGRKHLLIHAVSVGEVNAAARLVGYLETHAPEIRLTISAMTDTGFARALTLFGPPDHPGRQPGHQHHGVARFPYDFSFAVNRFLNRLKPDAVALMELEVWPNFMEACTQRHIPVAVVNGRLTARSYKGYRRVKPLIQKAFSQLTAAGVQTAAFAKHFEGVGVDPGRIFVMDSMKWDSIPVGETSPASAKPDENAPASDGPVPGANPLPAAFGLDLSKPIVTAGSTAPGEDEMLLAALPTWPKDTQLILAPRKPEWFEHVAGLVPGAIRRSQTLPSQSTDAAQDAASTPADPSPASSGGGGGGDSGGLTANAAGKSVNVFILDTIGELKHAYALADVCVVGRSFTGALYGSDLMEPIGLGKPTIIGPHHSDFQDAVDAFAKENAVKIVDSPGPAVAELLKDSQAAKSMAQRGLQVIESRRGATERYANLILGLMNSETTR